MKYKKIYVYDFYSILDPLGTQPKGELKILTLKFKQLIIHMERNALSWLNGRN